MFSIALVMQQVSYLPHNQNLETPHHNVGKLQFVTLFDEVGFQSNQILYLSSIFSSNYSRNDELFKNILDS